MGPLQAGDVVGFNAGAWDSRIIAALTRDRGERPTRWTHVEQMVHPDYIARQIIRKRVEKWKPEKRSGLIEAFRYIHLNDAERAAIAEYHARTVGRWYAAWRIPVFAWRWAAGRLGIVSGREAAMRQDRRGIVCSSDVAKAFAKATGDERFFGRHFTDVAPDDIRDHIEQHPDDWTLVWRRDA